MLFFYVTHHILNSQGLTAENKKNKLLEIELTKLKLEKEQVLEASRLMEVEMNKALHKAKPQEKEKCLHVLTQSHTRFSRLNEVSDCKAFRLGWEQALLDPLVHNFFDPKAFDAVNRVESNNYNLDYYVTKENLGVNFAEKLKEETETQGEGSQISKSGHPDPSYRD